VETTSVADEARRQRALVAMAVAALGCASLLPGPTTAESEAAPAESQFYGPLRSRDLTPFGYLRLDMRPAFTGDVAPGRWAVETEFGFQNTWAVSEPVERYLRSRPSRGDLGEADVVAIRGLPGDNFLVDLELAELGFTVHRQFTPHWGAFAVITGVAYGGGALDGLIEQTHSALGVSHMGRRGLSRDQFNVVMDLESLRYASLDAGAHSGLLDPTLGVRYSGLRLPEPWSVVLEAAIKIPVAGERRFLSTGRSDAGVQASVMRRGSRHAFYASLVAVDYAGSRGVFAAEGRTVPTVVAGFESHLAPRWHSIVQLYASPSLYDRDVTRLDELTSNKYLLSAGLRYHRGSQLFTAAVTENLAHMDNTPDVGFQLGWAYRPASR
jgi:hypothetical protein